jgi:hypothetical protein
MVILLLNVRIETGFKSCLFKLTQSKIIIKLENSKNVDINLKIRTIKKVKINFQF